jgi:hypothetical protein
MFVLFVGVAAWKPDLMEIHVIRIFTLPLEKHLGKMR